MLFHGPVVRPPTNADNVFIELTIGCTHNSCTFCNFYDGYPFHMAKWEDIEAGFKEAARYQPNAKRIWASGGNPFALSNKHLERFAELRDKYLPKAHISMYARVDDLVRKSLEDMKKLREMNYDDVVVGFESGDDDVLAHVNKGYTRDDVLAGCKKLEEAGIPYRMIYLGGIAGKGKLTESAEKTLSLLNQLHPVQMFLTTVAIMKGTKLWQEMEEGAFIESDERERLEEARTIIAGLKHPISIYAHTSTNLINYDANLPDDREKVLRAYDQVLSQLTDDVDEEMRRYRRSRQTV